MSIIMRIYISQNFMKCVELCPGSAILAIYSKNHGRRKLCEEALYSSGGV